MQTPDIAEITVYSTKAKSESAVTRIPRSETVISSIAVREENLQLKKQIIAHKIIKNTKIITLFIGEKLLNFVDFSKLFFLQRIKVIICIGNEKSSA